MKPDAKSLGTMQRQVDAAAHWSSTQGLSVSNDRKCFCDADFAAREKGMRSTMRTAMHGLWKSRHRDSRNETCRQAKQSCAAKSASPKQSSVVGNSWYLKHQTSLGCCLRYPPMRPMRSCIQLHQLVTKAAAHAKQLAGIMHMLGFAAGAVVGSDVSAGIGIASRQTCGKLRHIEAKWLWVKDEIAAHRLKGSKVPTEVNPADLAMKYLLAPPMRVLQVLLNLKLVEAHHKADARIW